MGLMQRNKGKRFEREIAALMRERWPTVVVRRASQAERADNPDVFVESGPERLRQLWLELENAKAPSPHAKLMQAEGDIRAWNERRGFSADAVTRVPFVVWHRLAARSIQVTSRLWCFDWLMAGPMPYARPARMQIATIDSLDFFELLARVQQPSEVAA